MFRLERTTQPRARIEISLVKSALISHAQVPDSEGEVIDVVTWSDTLAAWSTRADDDGAWKIDLPHIDDIGPSQLHGDCFVITENTGPTFLDGPHRNHRDKVPVQWIIAPTIGDGAGPFDPADLDTVVPAAPDPGAILHLP